MGTNRSLGKRPFKLSLPGHAHPYYFDRIAALYGLKAANRLKLIWVKAFRNAPGQTTYQRFGEFDRTLRKIDQLAKEDTASILQDFRCDLNKRSGPLNGKVWKAAIIYYIGTICPRWNRATKAELSKRECLAYTFNSIFRIFEGAGLSVGFTPIDRLRNPASKTPIPTLGELQSSNILVNSSTPQNTLYEMAGRQVGLTRTRYEELKKCMILDFMRLYESWEKGRTYIRLHSEIGIRRLEEFIEHINLSNLKHIIDSDPDKNACYIEEVYGKFVCYLYMKHFNDINFRKLPPRYFFISNLFGGAKELLHHLRPNNHTANLVCGIIIAETGFNVSSVEDLPSAPFIDNSQHGKITISTIAARKRRAGGRAVYGIIKGQEYSISTSRRQVVMAYDVIVMYQKMTEELREIARKKDQGAAADRLIIYPSRGGFSLNTFSNNLHSFAGEEWKLFLNRHVDNPIIGGLPITRASLRKSLLQMSYFDNDADISIPQSLADHAKPDVTFTHYLNTSWMSEALMEDIRQFQNALEASVTDSIDWLDYAGISRAEMATRRQAAATDGLRFYCHSRQMDAQVLARTGPSCTPLQPCENCPAQRIYPSPAAYQALTLTAIALDRAKDQFERTNPKRWRAVWMPWLAVVTVYQRRLECSPYQFAYLRERDATILAVEAGQLMPPDIF